MHSLEIQLLCQGCLVDDPRQVGNFHSTREYRAGDAEARAVDLQSTLLQELSGDCLQAGVVRAVDLSFRERRVGVRLLRENTDRGLCPTDITCQQHGLHSFAPSIRPAWSIYRSHSLNTPFHKIQSRIRCSAGAPSRSRSSRGFVTQYNEIFVS